MLFHPIMSRGQIRGHSGTKRDNGQTQKGDKRGHISIDMSPIVPECPLVQFVPQPTLKGFKEMTEKRKTLTLKRIEPPKSRTQRNREQIGQVREIMQKYTVIEKAYPLKIGINADIVSLPELAEFPKYIVGAWLAIHCNSAKYKANLQMMIWRYDLQANRIGRIGGDSG